MNSERHNEAAIFNTARRIVGVEERRVYLAEACGADEKLRERIETLLAAYVEESQFLEQPLDELQATLLTGPNGENLAASLEAGFAPAFGEDAAVVVGDASHSVLKLLSETLGQVPRVALRESANEEDDRIVRSKSSEMPQGRSDSRYQLQGEIARGGMGAIIKGRDTDLGRDLAIKVLLDQHKDKPEVIQRFVEEAQIGGQLQHPGIAPIYELGQFSDQRPFFAMKLVKGQTLSKLLAEREEPAEDRGRFLGIFEQVCQTMAYAHSRGVIHRDLKPANIMVGSFGEVQVMDWGLAKVLPTGGIVDEKHAHDKQHGQSVIQTLRSKIGSDAPGVVGSLGSQTQMGSVMGTPAYMPPEQALGEIDLMDERADVFGLGAILCEILTGKPPYVADDGTQVYRMASRGKLDDCFKRLDHSGADVDLIILTRQCLELEPSARPRNASVVAERVTAYLESVEQKLRETELAKADALVRAEELKRRNRLALSAGTVIVTTLVIGISASLWQMARANTAEQLAREEAVRATAAERLAVDETARATAAEQATAETLKEVAAERDAKELALNEARQISGFLINVFQSPDPNRDGYDIKVVELLDNAAKKLETDLADQPEQRVRMQETLGDTYLALGLYHQGALMKEQVWNYHLTKSGPEHLETVQKMIDLASAYLLDGSLTKSDKARLLFEEVVRVCRKVSGPEHLNTLLSMANLSHSLQGDERAKLSEEVLTLSRKVLDPEHPLTLNFMRDLAVSYDGAGRRDEALTLREEVLRLSRKVRGPEHPDTLGAMVHLAASYSKTDHKEEAVKLNEEVLTLYRKRLGPEHPNTLNAMVNLAASYHYAGRTEEAVKLDEEVLKLYRKILGPEHPTTLNLMRDLTMGYGALGYWDEERLQFREELLRLFRKVHGPAHPATMNMFHLMVIAYDKVGRKDDKYKLFDEQLSLLRNGPGRENPDTIVALRRLATGYDRRGFELGPGREEESIAAWRIALELNPNNKTRVPYHLGLLLEARGESGEAFTAYLTAVRNGAKQVEASQKIQGILKDPGNLESCLQAVKSNRDLKLAAFTSFASFGWAEEARSLLAEFSVTNPEETMLATQAAALQAWFGQADEYNGFRQRTLAWAADTEDSAVAERVARLACLRPMENPESQAAAVALTTRAVELGQEQNEFLPLAQLSLGMAEYRNGRYEQAATALSAAGATALEKKNASIEGTSNFYRAMCLFQQDKADEAQFLFKATEAKMKPLPTDEKQPLANNANHDDLILWLAHREAKALLTESDTPKD